MFLILFLACWSFALSDEKVTHEEWTKMRYLRPKPVHDFIDDPNEEFHPHHPHHSHHSHHPHQHHHHHHPLQDDLESIMVNGEKMLVVNENNGNEKMIHDNIQTIKEGTKKKTKLGAGHRIAGLPVVFATGSKRSSSQDDCPCRSSSAAQTVMVPSSDGEKTKNMVRVIIEMPEHISTKNPDEIGRYAASQMKKLSINKKEKQGIKDKTKSQHINNEANYGYLLGKKFIPVKRVVVKPKPDSNRDDKIQFYAEEVSPSTEQEFNPISDKTINGFDRYKKIIRVYRDYKL